VETTGAKTKYYLLALLGALVVGGLLLVVAVPDSQARESSLPTMNKKCSPDPVRVGQRLTCTLDIGSAPLLFFPFVDVTDTFPAGVRPTRAT